MHINIKNRICNFSNSLIESAKLKTENSNENQREKL